MILSPEEALNFNGKIPSCSSFNCGWKCCRFHDRPDYHIVLYPGELEEAVAKGYDVSHLKVIRGFRGGYRAVCTAKNRINCDGKYKTDDCRGYPIYPAANDEGQIICMTYDVHCPLTRRMDLLDDHRAFVAQLITARFKNRPDLEDFWRYDSIEEGFVRPVPFPELHAIQACAR